MRSIYSFINLTGLTVGLSAFILIFLWVEDEWSYDRFHQNGGRIYRVVEKQFTNDNDVYPVALTPAPLAPYLKSNYAEVESVCRVGFVDFNVRKDEKIFLQKGIVADPEAFDLFTFPVVAGDLKTFAGGIDVLLITEKLSRIYFGDIEAAGKTLTILGKEFLIAAVLKDIPNNSHILFDFVIPMEFVRTGGYDALDRWNYQNYHTYVKLASEAGAGVFETKIKEVVKYNNPNATLELLLQPLTDIHLKSDHLNNDSAGRGNILYVYIFSAIGVFILVIASINYANLATARSLKRAKEAGVRKVIGANKMQLIIHFFSESFLYSVMAFVAALVVSWIMLPSFNELSGKDVDFDLSGAALYLPLIASIIFCAFLGGAYPALLLSSLNPAHVLKGYFKNGRGTILFRRTLVIFQFVLAISFLTGTFMIKNQLDYIRTRDLGFQKENILTFSANRKLRQQFQAFKSELLLLPGVQSVTATNARISNISESSDRVNWEGKHPDKNILFHLLPVEFDFIKTFSIEVVQGRDFSSEIFSDSSAVLLNEEAVRQMALKDPVAKTITLNDERKVNVIGVVKDFNFKSAHKKIEPMLIYIDNHQLYETAVSLSAGNLAEQVNSVRQVFNKFNPGIPFDYTFIDEDIDRSYRNEERTSYIFNIFSVLSIFISCLGLLGMVMFVTEQRAKEVALRKVLGASALSLVWMLTYEFIVLVFLAFLIAAPAMYYTGTLWLNNFAYRVDPEVVIFIQAGLISLLVATLTVGLRSFKVALTNPVGPLRSE